MSSKLFNKFKERQEKQTVEEMSMTEFLRRVKEDPSIVGGPAERLLKAIGDPVVIDKNSDPRLRRLYPGVEYIKRYPAFDDFYGLETQIEEIVGFIRYSSQGLEECRQVMYLLGPPGSAKSSLAIRLRELMTREPIYVIKGSPIYESPLWLFDMDDSEDIGVDRRYLNYSPSSWALKRLAEVGGDISKIKVQKIYPNEGLQQAIAVTVAGDPNTQDVSTLVGKIDYRRLEEFSQNDPDCYNYCGALCKANQGIMEFVEMFKADEKILNPLLTATQEHQYEGTEKIGLLPFQGLILAHSNESEWQKFCKESTNEAFLDRINLIKIPYVLSYDDEVKIYKKMLAASELKNAPCAPGTLESLSKFVVASRLELADESQIEVKLLAYNGENISEKFPNSDDYKELKKVASPKEGFVGISTRDAFKVLSKTFNYDETEIGAHPVSLLAVLHKNIQDSLDRETDAELIQSHEAVLSYIEDCVYEKIGRVFQEAFLGSGFDDLGQNKFERYIVKAKYWLEADDYRDPETGTILDKAALNTDLEAIEKPAQIANHKEFRNQVVRFALEYQSTHGGKMPSWRAYRKVRDVLEKSLFDKMEDLLPVLGISGLGNKEQKAKYKTFLGRMKEMGYTERQTRKLQDWFLRKQTFK